MKILVLAAGATDDDANSASYPALLAEESGGLLIERLIESCSSLKDVSFIFALRERDIIKHHLDKVVQLVVPSAQIIRVREATAGAACTSLLASDYLSGDEELLILNGNELIDADFAAVIADFHSRNLDGGTLVFPSIHPRYSYVRLDENGLVTEAAEKSPISRNATAGFYWYRRASDFMRSAEAMIRKDDGINGVYYVCPVFNQMILQQQSVGIFRISLDQYHPVKSRRQLELLELQDLARLRP